MLTSTAAWQYKFSLLKNYGPNLVSLTINNMYPSDQGTLPEDVIMKTYIGAVLGHVIICHMWLPWLSLPDGGMHADHGGGHLVSMQSHYRQASSPSAR